MSARDDAPGLDPDFHRAPQALPTTTETPNVFVTAAPSPEPNAMHSAVAHEQHAPLTEPEQAATQVPNNLSERSVHTSPSGTQLSRLQQNVSGPRSQPAADAAPKRPRGLKKLLAMMTCSSGSATAAAANDHLQSKPAHDSTLSKNGQAPKLQNLLGIPASSTAQTVGSTQEKNGPIRSSIGAGLASGGVLGAALGGSYHDDTDAHLPSRDSVIGPPTTAGHTEEEYAFGNDIITSVSPTGGAPTGYALDLASEQELYAAEQRLIQQGGNGIPLDESGKPRPLLAPTLSIDANRKCLVLDLDETLVHSSFKMVPNADFIVPVEIDGVTHNVYVIKRPGVDEFMRLMGQIYEVVIFTASLNKYADPVIDILDMHKVVRHRLFRESCHNHHGNYVKDLSQLGRPLHDTIILDNSPASYIFHPTNAVPVSSWFNDPHDTELTDLCPFLDDLTSVDDVRIVLDGFIGSSL
ncbi:protein-serine/threonine phosphatase [Malassezia vespertilionis]|uniref:protein-serine/threonine phosphatase n=1 Tax=Malassezia vespertilionis TaxID=2020962 RepID=A0A2N1JCU0_9BASI|nr:protein-serine/threonine phosphatase [Malassezia vespertilionis]PKI84354.1 hypothetical protein MVES_001762 [Malassezia vespertilionis]WFD06513.1 protein-serine/threonine phosphatase [Malassezia vespertilionis]